MRHDAALAGPYRDAVLFAAWRIRQLPPIEDNSLRESVYEAIRDAWLAGWHGETYLGLQPMQKRNPDQSLSVADAVGRARLVLDLVWAALRGRRGFWKLQAKRSSPESGIS